MLGSIQLQSVEAMRRAKTSIHGQSLPPASKQQGRSVEGLLSCGMVDGTTLAFLWHCQCFYVWSEQTVFLSCFSPLMLGSIRPRSIEASTRRGKTSVHWQLPPTSSAASKRDTSHALCDFASFCALVPTVVRETVPMSKVLWRIVCFLQAPRSCGARRPYSCRVAIFRAVA